MKLDIKYMVHGTKYFPVVFRGSQTQGDHFLRYPNLNTWLREFVYFTVKHEKDPWALITCPLAFILKVLLKRLEEEVVE